MTDNEKNINNPEAKNTTQYDGQNSVTGQSNRIQQGKQRTAFGAANARGIRRLQPTSHIRKPPAKSALKKAFPYLLAGGSTGLGLGTVFYDLIF